MFESLADRLNTSIRKLRGEHVISESNIDQILRDVRLNFLEADVNYKVVKSFLENIKAKTLGTEVHKKLNPSQQMVQIVFDELKALLGGDTSEINLKGHPAIVMAVGLQGSGKTTSMAKLALHLKTIEKKNPALIPCDVYRPAAIQQLTTLGKQMGIPVFASEATQKPVEIVRNALEWARIQGFDVLLVDTAGRLQIDEALMQELKDLKTFLNPSEIIFVADAMTGQEAVNVASKFNEDLDFHSVLLTKMDGDARGGAALSIKSILGKPIKFMGLGEKPTEFEVFHPERVASRILDMGDVLSLVEKAQSVINEDDAAEMTEKMLSANFSLNDFLTQLRMIKKMGPMSGILKMLPGMGEQMKKMEGMTPPDDEMKKVEAILSSMTLKERANHAILNGSRRERIAKGSGTQVSDVNKLIKQFMEMQKMMKMFSKMGLGSMLKGGKMPDMSQFGGGPAGMRGMPQMPPGMGGGGSNGFMSNFNRGRGRR